MNESLSPNEPKDQEAGLHRALIDCMTLASAADNLLKPVEMRLLGSLVAHLPVFKDFDLHHLSLYVDDCLDRLKQSNSLDDMIAEIASNLPPSMHETAYALAVDVVAADLNTSDAELSFLQLLRQTLGLDRLICAGIERGARAHFQTP
ncbi:MAG: tellurite resistance TerB family protein [Alphaproteobacteria bacterium]